MDLSYSDEPGEHGWILIRGRLKHLPRGHFEDLFMPAPLDTSGGKSSVQGVGSTNSYLRRYIACNIFNIVVVGDDDDGNGGTIERGADHNDCRSDQKSKSRAEVSEIHASPEHRGGGSWKQRSRRLPPGIIARPSALWRNRWPRRRWVMPLFHEVAQYSEEYDRLKLGIPTSSNFHKIITPEGKPSKQWRVYACVLIAERILHQRIESYNSPAMERGLIVESEAADWYEFDHDVTVRRIGFITDDGRRMGCSPDRLVGEDGVGIGNHFFLPQTQVEYWLSGEVSQRFRPQLQGQLYISHRSWVDILCWHDVLPKLVVRVEPDLKFIEAPDRELRIFNYFIERVMEKDPRDE